MNRLEPDWGLYRSFLAVMQEGSLSGAARMLGLTQPTLARHIDALERALGLALFSRSQGGLAATDAALELGPYAEALAATTAAMTRVALGHGQAVKGTVRVTASEIIGAKVLPAVFASLRAQHPALEIELVLSNAVDDLLRRDVDIAVRMVEPAQQALVVRRVGRVTLGLHAHRHYLARAGVPRRLAELRGHSLIGFDRETPAIRAIRRRVAGLKDARFALRADSDIAQLMAIRAGFGIGACQVALARRDPNLERVLSTAFSFELGVWIAMHETLRSVPRCRVAFDALVAGLKAHVD